MNKLMALPLALITLAVGVGSASAAEPQTCVDERTGSERSVTVRLTEGGDYFVARPNDVIAALGGNDVIDISYAPGAVICLGAGSDRTIGTGFGGVSIRGGAGDDYITGSSGNDYLNGVDGNDVVNGLGGFDVARGGAGFDQSFNNEVVSEFEA
jgi:Ca2+-binding RTX toxin-like protein